MLKPIFLILMVGMLGLLGAIAWTMYAPLQHIKKSPQDIDLFKNKTYNEYMSKNQWQLYTHWSDPKGIAYVLRHPKEWTAHSTDERTVYFIPKLWSEADSIGEDYIRIEIDQNSSNIPAQQWMIQRFPGKQCEEKIKINLMNTCRIRLTQDGKTGANDVFFIQADMMMYTITASAQSGQRDAIQEALPYILASFLHDGKYGCC